jgi:hypothetical protein
MKSGLIISKQHPLGVSMVEHCRELRRYSEALGINCFIFRIQWHDAEVAGVTGG